MLRRNIAFNVLGGSWVALAALAIIPFQVRILGPEAYGLLAFIASVQVLFSILDLGLSPTITREVAGRSQGDDAVALVRTLWPIYFTVGLLLGLALIAGSDWLATRWLHLERLPARAAADALKLAGAWVAIRWPVSFLGGVLAGRQRFALLNALKAAAATVMVFGGVAVILLTHDLVAYTGWMVTAAAIEVTAYIVAVTRVLPGAVARPALDLGRLRGTLSFAAGVNLINILSMVLTQSDRLLIGRLLTVRTLGYYAVAYNIVYGLSLIPNFITSAMFPAFVTSHARNDVAELRDRYHKATQVLMACYNLPAWVLVFFGYQILLPLTTATTARQAAPILSALAVGFLFNAVAVVAYTACLATGNTRIPIQVNAVAVAFYLPLLVILTLRYGGLGAAIAWTVLNAYYLPVLVPLAHAHIGGIATPQWLLRDVLPFALLASVAVGGARLIAALTQANGLAITALLLVVTGGIYAAGALRLLEPALRRDILGSRFATIAGSFLMARRR